MAAPTYKLSYFAVRGLGEVSRLIFAATNTPFTDDRLTFVPKPDGSFDRGTWEQDKSKFPFEKVPVLEVDGQQISQSKAIERFLGKRLGLFGSTDIEGAQIDALIEQNSEFRQGIQTAKTKDAHAKANGQPETHAAHFFADKAAGAPHYFALFERYLSKQANKDYFVGGKLSVFDIQLYYFIQAFDALTPLAKEYPLVHAVTERVHNNAGIAKWEKERPVTPF